MAEPTPNTKSEIQIQIPKSNTSGAIPQPNEQATIKKAIDDAVAAGKREVGKGS